VGYQDRISPDDYGEVIEDVKPALPCDLLCAAQKEHISLRSFLALREKEHSFGVYYSAFNGVRHSPD